MSEKNDDARELKADAVSDMPVPDLPYQPIGPKAYSPKIGLVGCGGITKSHLGAYAKMGWEVVAMAAGAARATDMSAAIAARAVFGIVRPV